MNIDWTRLYDMFLGMTSGIMLISIIYLYVEGRKYAKWEARARKIPYTFNFLHDELLELSECAEMLTTVQPGRAMSPEHQYLLQQSDDWRRFAEIAEVSAEVLDLYKDVWISDKED